MRPPCNRKSFAVARDKPGKRNKMVDTQHFCLRWNNYQSSITSAFENLRDDEDFVDVTLACDGRSLKAHRVVLSACSPYFRELLKVRRMLGLCLFNTVREDSLRGGFRGISTTRGNGTGFWRERDRKRVHAKDSRKKSKIHKYGFCSPVFN